MTGTEAITFICMMIVLPVFIAVFAVACLFLSPILVPMYVIESRRPRRS